MKFKGSIRSQLNKAYHVTDTYMYTCIALLNQVAIKQNMRHLFNFIIKITWYNYFLFTQNYFKFITKEINFLYKDVIIIIQIRIIIFGANAI